LRGTIRGDFSSMDVRELFVRLGPRPGRIVAFDSCIVDGPAHKKILSVE
jgi:hypothetical protein